jgi:repressor LexA
VPKHGEDKPDKIIPILGSVAAGTPIEAQEDVINTITVPENFNVDFGLKVKGNSMTGVGINDGDIVLIHQQPSLENGEIGVIDIEGEVTLKRFYVDDKKVMLLSENPANPPILINGKECTKKNLRILGKAIYFIGKVK